MPSGSHRIRRSIHPGFIHFLNRRYHDEWVRAELLANELEGMKRSRIWRFVSRLRKLWPRRAVVCPHLLEGSELLTTLPQPSLTSQVSIIIPFRDQVDLLRNCLHGLKRSTHRRWDVVLVNNGSTEVRTLRYLSNLQKRSRVRIVNAPGPFNFSKLCNLGAFQASGDHLLFLNNDTEVLARRWLEHMLRVAADPRVGIVGATLLYPDRTIQHVGVFPQSDGVWVHPYRGHTEAMLREHSELNQLRSVPAVTGACLMIRRNLFAALHGFDERLAVAYNDVDLCVRVRKQGLIVAITPEARLIHYEGLSRGYTVDRPPIDLD